MKMDLHDQIVVIVGAGGGLGAAFARAFARQGARLVLAGRNPARLQPLVGELAPQAESMLVDISDAASVQGFAEAVFSRHSRVDVLVNASGVDIRKPFVQHTPDDFKRSLDANLAGAMFLTWAFLPNMQASNQGMIVHVGGFADGRLAFPYYTADVASRAGLYSFIEALNRELGLENSGVVVAYFSPSPADTPAERPFHPIWREMGTKVVSPQAVADALLKMIQHRKKVFLMGGWPTAFFARLNAALPRLADGLLLDQYGRILQKYLGTAPGNNPRQGVARLRYLAAGLIVLSFVLYGLLLLLPFGPFPLAARLALAPVLIALGEATFWIGGMLLGKEVLGRYRAGIGRFFCRLIGRQR